MTKYSLFMILWLGFGIVQAQQTLSQSELYPNFKNEEHTALNHKRDTFEFKKALLKMQANDFRFAVNPAFDFMTAFDQRNEELINRWGLGVDLKAEYRKWEFGFTYLSLQSDYLDYQKRFIDQNSVVPGMNVAEGSRIIQSDYIDGYVNYQAGKYFNLELGYGRNFIGDGYRSLLLSDFSNAAPYLKVKTEFWKLQYTNVFAMQENIFNVAGKPSWYQRKYTATHFLDWKATDWLSIGLFETIVWAADDGQYQRGMDVNYLNPVIFYRPVEFSVGSSDNALVGANLKLTPFKNHKFYFQLLFDEFLLDELRADLSQWRNPDQDIESGWWANKYGIQAGWEANDLMGLKGLQSRFEFNLVRPFTYAHSNPTQAYSHYNMSLAHPLGANFHELVTQINYVHNKWRLGLQYNNALKGESPMGVNHGDNLQLSNTSREKEYENFIGQGLSKRIEYVDANVSYLLKPEWKCTATLGWLWRQEAGNDAFQNDQMIYLRLRTNLYKQYFDF